VAPLAAGDRDQYYRGEGERMGYGDARGAGGFFLCLTTLNHNSGGLF